MRVRNIKFLAKANLKGNTKTTSVVVTTLILIICLTLISSLSNTVNRRIEEYKSDPRAKMVAIYPSFYLPNEGLKNNYLDTDTLEAVKNISCVEEINIQTGEILIGELFTIDDLTENNVTDKSFMKQVKKKDGCISILSLTGSEQRPVIVGKSLDDSPEFSCIIPDKFYPFQDQWKLNENTEYLNGADFIGKTLTLKPSGKSYRIVYNIDALGSVDMYLEGIEFKLNIVGVYRDSPTNCGGPETVFVSKETAKMMDQTAINASTYPFTEDEERWFNDPTIHPHIVTIDNYDNLELFYEKLKELNIWNDGMPKYNLPPGTLDIATIFNTASAILITASIILSIIIIIQSSVNSLLNRRSELGLLKAIGYKNKQIFSILFSEQLILTLRGFIIGGGLSVIAVAILNYINSYTLQGNPMYLISWIDVIAFSALSLGIVIFVPLLCQVIMLYKLNKIQPREAMKES